MLQACGFPTQYLFLCKSNKIMRSYKLLNIVVVIVFYNGTLKFFLLKIYFFQPSKLSESIEEAKSVAAEEILSHLGLQADGTPAVLPMATVISPPSTSYQVRIMPIVSEFRNEQ